MAYVHLRPQVELTSEPHRDGHQLWRSELYLHRRLIECTLWADTPTEAMKDGHAAADRWARMRQWIPERAGAVA